MDFAYKYPRMLVTVDALVFLIDSSQQFPKILLIQRKNQPFKDSFALPGGFVEMDELLCNAAKRELFEETGLQGVELNQLATFDNINRDPRDRNICIAYYGFTTLENSQIKGGDDAKNAVWVSLNNLPPLAFDHSEIIKFARNKLDI
ncbi:MAG: NUDIX hydrolase [Bacteroidales bacterium]|nr:NUDIX hydrolase [Bacteroidales bacterium]